MRRLVLGIAVAVTSLMPTIGMADDQQIADYIKNRLQVEQQNGNLRGFNVDMRVDRGTVWFKGHVSQPSQEQMILKTAQQAGHLGVVQVVDDIDVKSGAQSVVDRGPSAAVALPRMQQQPTMASPQPLQNVGYQQPSGSGMMSQPMPNPYQQSSAPIRATEGLVNGGQPLPFASNMGPGAAPGPMGPGGPGPMGPGPMMGPAMQPPQPGQYAGTPMAMPASYGSQAGLPMESPNLPGYAWPGYAANPNYAAVTYPKQYSPSAWPYIGPFYPYPQVPLGWRKVSLEWDDGWWMLDFHDKCDW